MAGFTAKDEAAVIRHIEPFMGIRSINLALQCLRLFVSNPPLLIFILAIFPVLADGNQAVEIANDRAWIRYS
jgi:hypothetical protein